MAKNWIKGAIKHPGSFKKSAHAAGKSTRQYAEEKKNAGGTTGKRARLALTLMKMHGGGKKKSSPKSSRNERIGAGLMRMM